MTTRTTDIVVIGGGVIGCSIAWQLAERGARVTLLEQGALASGASGASAGGVRQQGRDQRELPLAIAATAKWHELEAALDADVHYRQEGHLTVVERVEDLPDIEAGVAAQRAIGLDLHILTGDDLREVAPGLAPTAIAGTWSPEDGHANPILTTHAFARAAARAGAEIRTGCRVTGIEVHAGRVKGVTTTDGAIACDHLVVAAGLWSPALAAPLGIDLPVSGFAPQMLATDRMPLALRPVLGARSRRLSLKQIPTGNYVIGGGWPGDVHIAAGVSTARLASITGSIEDATAIWPALADATLERVWVGYEALAADDVPILGPLPGIGNLDVAAGFSGHGFQLSPIVGQLIAERVLDGETSVDIAPLGFERFASPIAGSAQPGPKAG